MTAIGRCGGVVAACGLLLTSALSVACVDRDPEARLIFPGDELPMPYREGLSWILSRFGERPLREYVTPEVGEAVRHIALVGNRVCVDVLVVRVDDRVQMWTLVYDDEMRSASQVERVTIERLEVICNLAKVVASCLETVPTGPSAHTEFDHRVEGWIDADIVETWVDGRYSLVFAPRSEDSAPARLWECIARESSLRLGPEALSGCSSKESQKTGEE